MRKRTCKSRKSWFLTVGALLLAASVGFGVPLAFRKWQDDRRLSVVETEEAPEVRITSQTELSMVEKAELFQSADASTTVLEKGKNYDVTGSLAKAEEELAILCEMGVLDETFRTAEMTEQSADPIFYIDPSGEKSMIIWRLNSLIDTEKGRWILEAALDDETGKLLVLGIQEWNEGYGNGIRFGAAATDSDVTDSDVTDSDVTDSEDVYKRQGPGRIWADCLRPPDKAPECGTAPATARAARRSEDLRERPAESSPASPEESRPHGEIWSRPVPWREKCGPPGWDC